MGKRNSKLKQDTIDKLIEDTYCEYYLKNISLYYSFSIFFFKSLKLVCILSKEIIVLNLYYHFIVEFLNNYKHEKRLYFIIIFIISIF